MELALARSSSPTDQRAAQGELHADKTDSFKPAADKMSLEVWEHSYKGTNKEIRVPLMKTGLPFSPTAGGTILPANDATAQLYMEARESMGRVITSGGSVVGSGFFLNTDGLFSTLYHVTEDNTEIAVETGDGQVHRAKIVEKDPANDTVLLQVEKNSKSEHFKSLKVAPFSDLKPGEKLLACGFGENTVLHCSPGIYDYTLQQKDIKLKESAPYLDPNRELVHSAQHTVNGDSGGLEFRLSDGTVRLLIDMTDNNKNTVSIPAERLLELEAKNRSQNNQQAPKSS